MNSGELLIVLLIGAVILVLPLATFVMSIVAYVRSQQIRELSKRIQRLEQALAGPTVPYSSLPSGGSPVDLTNVSSATGVEPAASTTLGSATVPLASAVSVPDAGSPSRASNAEETPIMASISSEPVAVQENAAAGWENFIGQKAFGWMAVILFLFSAAFFLRYAYQNQWIGPVGRVAVGELAGLALVFAGASHARKGWRRFAGMLTAAGIVTLYFSTYAAFGLYRLLPQSHTGVFLTILVAESMLIAVLYRAPAVALAAVLGGLATPLLMASTVDSYRSFFIYLAVLNLGTVVATVVSRWVGISSLCYLGTQFLFWAWHASQYHPEKFAWAAGLQLFLFVLYVAQSMWEREERESTLGLAAIRPWELIARTIVNALVGFASLQILLGYEYQHWLGTLAIGMASVHAFVANQAIAGDRRNMRLLFTSVALSLGFIAWALPLQAQTYWYELHRWIAMGWAIIGYALWRFGLRIAAPLLRVYAGVFFAAAVTRLLVADLPLYVRDPFVPIFNGFAFPSLIVGVCLLLGVLAADRYLPRLHDAERWAIGLTGVVGVALVWIVLSFECYDFFVSRSLLDGEIEVWRWRGHLAMTILWTLFATLLLVSGFKFDRPRLRWLGMALYGLTVLKLFFVDMANVQQIYRILAFFVLAVVLGLVARAYQRFK